MPLLDGRTIRSPSVCTAHDEGTVYDWQGSATDSGHEPGRAVGILYVPARIKVPRGRAGVTVEPRPARWPRSKMRSAGSAAAGGGPALTSSELDLAFSSRCSTPSTATSAHLITWSRVDVHRHLARADRVEPADGALL